MFCVVLLMTEFDVLKPYMMLNLKITDYDGNNECDQTTETSSIATCTCAYMYMAPEVLANRRFSKASDVFRRVASNVLYSNLSDTNDWAYSKLFMKNEEHETKSDWS